MVQWILQSAAWLKVIEALCIYAAVCRMALSRDTSGIDQNSISFRTVDDLISNSGGDEGTHGLFSLLFA